MKIEIKYDSREIDAFIRNTSKGELNKAVARALNRTGVMVKKETAKTIKQMPGMSKVPISEIKKGLPGLERARASQSISQQRELIGADTKSISLRYFNPIATGKGIKVTLPEGTHVRKHAFFARGKGAHVDTVFQRVRVRKKTEYKPRTGGHAKPELPIERVGYKGVALLLPMADKRIEKLANEKFDKELTHELKYQLSRKR